MTKLFHVVIKVTDPKMMQFGAVTSMTATPLPHAAACVILSKLTRYPWRQEMLQPSKGNKL